MDHRSKTWFNKPACRSRRSFSVNMKRPLPSLVAVSLCAALSVSAVASPAFAQAQMTVAQFLEAGKDIPRNRAAAMMRSDTRRLVRVVTGAVSQVKSEQAAAERAGRRPNHCIPSSGTGITPETLVARFEAMPSSRRNVTVTQAVREWMSERHPCRA